MIEGPPDNKTPGAEPHQVLRLSLDTLSTPENNLGVFLNPNNRPTVRQYRLGCFFEGEDVFPRLQGEFAAPTVSI